MNEAVIFLIDEDNDSRPFLRHNLKKQGYNIALAIDEEDASERVSRQCLRADLILMNFVSKSPESVLDIGRDIRRKGKLNAPVVVIAQKFGEDLEGKDVRVSENDYITYLEDGEQLQELLSRLVPVQTQNEKV